MRCLYDSHLFAILSLLPRRRLRVMSRRPNTADRIIRIFRPRWVLSLAVCADLCRCGGTGEVLDRGEVRGV